MAYPKECEVTSQQPDLERCIVHVIRSWPTRIAQGETIYPSPGLGARCNAGSIVEAASAGEGSGENNEPTVICSYPVEEVPLAESFFSKKIPAQSVR